MSKPVMFYTLMFTTASFELTTRGLSIEDSPQDLLYSESEAIKCLKEWMSKPETACSVENIYSVLVSVLRHMIRGGLGVSERSPRPSFEARNGLVSRSGGPFHS
jgi:hypothetical protein